MKKRLRNDIILIAALLISAALAWFLIRSASHRGSTVIVSIDGSDVASFPLDTDAVEEFATDEGHINVLRISNGKASIEYADCPDKLCVKRGEIYLSGQTIVCLPHKLVVRIKGEGGADAG